MDKKDATKKLDEIVGHALRDEEFRAKLMSEPEATLNEEGLSNEDLEKVSGGALSFPRTNLTANSVYSNSTQSGFSTHDFQNFLSNSSFANLWSRGHK
jgi:hypothetical protein